MYTPAAAPAGKIAVRRAQRPAEYVGSCARSGATALAEWRRPPYDAPAGVNRPAERDRRIVMWAQYRKTLVPMQLFILAACAALLFFAKAHWLAVLVIFLVMQAGA